VLQLREVEKPVPKHNEVRIRIHAAVVATADCNSRRGEPFLSRFVTGLRRPTTRILGFELAGEIESVGQSVTQYNVGDQVYGGTTLSLGAYAEYICLPEDGPVALKPANMTYGEAAAIVEGALTALPFLRDQARIQSGQKILIHGASGSIGTAAVQLAKYFGADVTGVCSGTNAKSVKSLGADRVIDYTREDLTKSDQAYDVIFAIVGTPSFSRCKGSLRPGGVYLTVTPTLAVIPQLLRIGSKRAIIAFAGVRPASAKTKDLVYIRELIETGKLRAVIDRVYPLEQIAKAHRYVERGHKKGNVVITVGHDSETTRGEA
jgi:NADPH:quinone reductase-like Zn-dependent oxidoreductase